MAAAAPRTRQDWSGQFTMAHGDTLAGLLDAYAAVARHRGAARDLRPRQQPPVAHDIIREAIDGAKTMG
jgi:hypothetical protein